MASAHYEETYVDGNVRRNTEQRSYEEINAYENEERTIGGRGSPTTPAMPPPQLSRNPPQQDAERSHEMKNYGMKWLAAAFVIVSVIFVGMFAAVFVMITTDREQGGSHKLQNETEYLGQDFQSRMTQLKNQLGDAFEKDKRYHKTLCIGRWMKFSNGLAYKLCVSEIDIDFANAEKECKDQQAQLASTGLRNSAIRR